MNNNFDIISFYNDYNVSNINCVDLTNAVYLGNYNPIFYYSYCFLYVCFSNWNISENDARYDTLRELGVSVENYTIQDFDDLKSKIIEGVNNGKPLLVYFKYRSLFYYKNYLDNKEKKYTALIINSYNEEKSTLSFLDMVLTRKHLYSIYTGEFFTPFQLTFDMFENMWRQSVNDFKDDSQYQFITNNAYSLKIDNKSRFKSLEDIIDFFINVLEKYKDRLLIEIEKYSDENAIFTYGITEKILQSYGISIYVITDMLKKYFINNGVNNDEIINFLHYYYKIEEP